MSEDISFFVVKKYKKGHGMEQNNYCVYMHVNKTNNKKYIGITKNKPEDRWQNGHGYKKQAFWNAIKKYGWENFEHIILGKNLSEEEACQKEIELISLYKSDDKRYGYNISHGGENGHNELWNDVEYYKAQVKERKERWNNKEYKQKMANAMKSAMSKESYIKKQSEKTRLRWEDGYFDSIHCKGAMCLETKKTYKSITEASKITNVCRASINKCCLNKQKTAGGFHWIFINETNYEDKDIQELINTIGAKNNIRIKCIEIGIIYNSIKEASQAINIDNSSIGKALKGYQKTSGGYHWEYV